MPEPKQTNQPHPVTHGPLDEAYHWLSQIEEMCRKAFISDDAILNRSRAKVASRTRPLKTVKIDVPKKEKGQLHVLPVSDSMDSWLSRLDAPLTDADERKAQEMASIGMANRDLLAHRIGRPTPTIHWQGCSTDLYNKGAKAYRRRLAAVGSTIADLGWLPEPATHPWRQKRQEPRPDMDQCESDAEANAAAWIGDTP